MKERVFKKLPVIHQTDVLDKFFKNTVDQWFDQEDIIQTSGYVGRKIAGIFDPKTDLYFPALNQTRENYQLEPILTIKDIDTADITNALFYDDILRLLSVEGSNISKQNRLFKSKAFSWAPPIDIDKFINYENYYWYQDGPIAIDVTHSAGLVMGTFSAADASRTAGTYTGVTGTSSGTGTVGTFTIVVDGTGNVTSVVVVTPTDGHSSHTVGDVITITDASLGAGGAANFTMQVATKPLEIGIDIIKKTSFTSANGIIFTNGSKVKFVGTNITASYVNKEYIVEGVGTSIMLIDVTSDDFNYILPYVVPGLAIELANRIEYITIKRGAINQNPWSRTNGWYHKDVLLQVTGKVTGTTFTSETFRPWDSTTELYDTVEWDSSLDILSETFSLDSARQAKRPIIEFDNNLELYKYGLEGIGNVSTVSTETFDTVHGATNPAVDTYTLTTGDTVIFLNDNLLNFNLWDTDAWDPGSHPAGVQTPPGPYADMPAGAAGDWDITMGTGASAFGIIYTVAIAGGTGVCTLSATTTVNVDQKVFTKKGKYYLGREFYWNGSKWQLSQLKDKQNDEPLFQLYDSDKNKLDDTSVYSASTFAGNKIFSYKTAASGTADIHIGKALQYKEFGQTADIVFTNNFEDTITDVIGYKYANQYDLSGTGAGPNEKIVSTYNNEWNPTSLYSEQRVVETFIASVDGEQIFTLSVSPTIDSTGFADVIITVDGKVAKQSIATKPYDYGFLSTELTFTTNKIIKAGQTIEIRSNTDAIVNINDNHYYEIPSNLEANPDNLDVDEITASELQDHFASIIKSQTGVIGNEIGTNNYRDTAKDRSKGTKILQHESSLLPMMVLLSQQDKFSITSSIRYNQNEYEVFKAKFMQKVEYYSTQTDASVISDFVDTVLADMYSLRSNLKIFTETNAFAYGTNYKEQIVYPDFNVTYIDMTELVTSADTDSREKIVYVYRTTIEELADSKQHDLLLKDTDYTIETTFNDLGVLVTRLTFTNTVERNTKIEIRVFENIQNSFVPLTPSMVGMYSVYLPRVCVDNTYVGDDRKFILGHDGSRTLFYGDLRDDALLELESRIYNAISATFIKEYLPSVNYFDLAPGKFRFDGYGSIADYSRFEFTRMLTPILHRWSIEHSVDLTTHRTYDESLPFTWNYSKELDKDGETVPGSWRGIYLHYYDSIEPHNLPWEMLGFSTRPTWWIATYGTSYGSTNTALWSDLEEGIIRSGLRENYTDGSYSTNNSFRRKGLSTVLPVDHLGKLLDPVQAGIFGTPSTKIIAGEYSVPNIVDRHIDWELGDCGPAEYSARINSVWPWIVNKLLYLLRPAEYSTKSWDTLNFTHAKANLKQTVFKDTNKRKQLKDFNFYSDTSIVYGFQPWIYSYLLSENKAYIKIISNVFKTSGVALGYKAGGFISKNFTAIADSYSTTRTTNSIFIPEENKNIVLYNGYSEGLRSYSGVKVTITETGYAVSGYDLFNSTFRIIPPISTSTYDTIEVGNLRVNNYHNNYDVIVEVPYNTEYQSFQEVFDFLVGYGKFLTSVGFMLDYYDYDVEDVLDFNYAGQEFLNWVQMSTWEVGTFIALSPAAAKIKIDIAGLGRIDTIKEIINSTYSIVDKDYNAMQMRDLDIRRDNDYFSVSNINGKGIYGLKLNPFRTEHAIIFDNKTDFNDLIYDPLLRLRQDRLKLNLSKTANWTGQLEAPGYIIQGNTIVPNFDTTANDYRKMYNVHDVPVTETLLDSARHLIGYQPRDYLDNITEDENTSFEFFKGMLRQKGNMESVNKLLRSKKLDNHDMSIFEEYAFKIGEFGATSINVQNEIQVKSSDVRIQNPLIEFTYEDNSIDVLIDDLIQINYTNDTRWINKPKFPKTQVWPKLAIGYTSDAWLPSAGYIHNEDITYKAFNATILAGLNTILNAATEPTIGSTAHVAKTDNDEFNVFKLVETDLTVRHSELLSTGKTEINVVDEVIPTVIGNTAITGLPITANVGDTIAIALDGQPLTTVTLSSYAYESSQPVMFVDVSNANLIRKDESIYVITPTITKQVVFASVPPGPVTVIGNVVNPKITETNTIKINTTQVTFTAGDTLENSGTGASYTGGIIGLINNTVPHVTAFNHNGYLQLTTTEDKMFIDTTSLESTIIDSDIGIYSETYYNVLTIDQIYNDFVATGIPDVFITKDDVKKAIILTGEHAKKIEVKKGIGEALRALYFTNAENYEVSFVDNRVITLADAIADINAAITNEDFLASTDINGNLQMQYNGASLHVSGTALPGLGLQSQTATLASSTVLSHPFKNNDIVVLNNIKDKDSDVLNIGGGYVVEEQVIYVNKSIDITAGVVTITDLTTNVITTLTNVSSIPIYDIISADRDFIEDFLLDITFPISPNNIQIGDTGTANSILPAFTAVNKSYTASNIGPYATIVANAGNIIISTMSAGVFVHGSFTVSMVIKKKGIFVIDDFEEKVANTSDKIQVWHPRRFTTKTEAFENVKLNKSFYSLQDLVWIDNKPSGWLVSKLADLKEHYGLTTLTISNGGNNYTAADINKTFTIDTFITDTKVQPTGKITDIQYGVSSVTVTSGGAGYTSPPSVTFIESGSGTKITTAIAKAVLKSVIASVTITDAGAGYQTLPGVEIYESLIYNGTTWSVEHNLNQKYVNLEIMDYQHNTIGPEYGSPIITYVDVNNLTIDWGTTATVGYIDVIKSEFVSTLQSSSDIWLIPHNLSQQYVNVNIIYNDDKDAIGRYSNPIIEYTDTNNLTIVFPVGTKRSGYVAVTYSDNYVPGASGGTGYTHTESAVSKTWTVTHNLGKRYVNVDVAFLGSDIDFTGLGNWAVAQHNLGQQYVNVALIDAADNLINTEYEGATVSFLTTNSLRIMGGSTKIDKVSVIKSKFVSSLQSAANTWTITHNLNQDIANVDIIYSDSTSASSRHDHPLVEYTDVNNIKVIFPTGVTKSGYAVVTHNDMNGSAPDFGYEHTEGSAATTWTITHNLGKKYVNVDIAVLGSTIASGDYSATIASSLYYNIKGLYDYPAIKFVDDNSLTITFNTAIAGKAVISGGDTFSANADTKYYNIKGNYDFPVINHVSANQLTATFNTPRAGKLMVSAGKGIKDDDSVLAIHMKVGTDGGCNGMTINAAGSGYSVSDTISVTGGTGIPVATGTVSSVSVGDVSSITVTNPGSGYASAPTVTIDPPSSGTTATATATVAGGAVTGVTITLAGDGYTSAPNVVFTGGGGSSAVAVATVTIIGAVTGITIADGGDYTVLPPYTNCETTASPVSGRIGLRLDLLFVVKSLGITLSDSFQSAPDIKITAPAYGGGGGCTPRQATAAATITGTVDSIQVLTNGEYLSVPTVGFTGGGGAGATATANLTGPVKTISLVTQGDITYLPSPLTNIAAVPVDTHVGTGLTLDIDFSIITSFDTWFETHRAEEQRINSALFDVATLYDTKELLIDAQPLLLDFPKGVIGGQVDVEISYRLNRDPARYNVTDDASSLVNDDLLWNNEQVGHLWWDTSTVRFYDAEQGSNRYRRTYWNQMFPGSSVDMYEWVQSTNIPADYKGTGTVKSVNQYSQIEEWNIAISKFVTNYYFWVRNKTTAPAVEWRKQSANTIASYISAPANTQWYAPISNHYERVDDVVVASATVSQTISTTGVDPALITSVRLGGIKVTYTNGTIASDDTITSITLTSAPVIGDLIQVTYRKPGGAMIINGIDRLITAEDSSLQLEYKVKNVESNVHKQWVLIRKNDTRSSIPAYFLNKMVDSLVGYDKAGLVIPDTSMLHKDRQHGTLYRPRQTWFKDVNLARKNFVIAMNTILTTLTVNDDKTGWDADVYNNQFIIYIDWWETDYSTATVIKHTVDTIAKRKLLTGLIDGDIVKVKNDGTNRWRVYKYVLATKTFLKIGAEKQTINFKTTTYTDTFTLTQSQDFRKIIDAIFNNVFTINWLVKTNEVFFGMISYVLSEQGDVDWIFKSSYLNIASAENNVKQLSNFKVELLPHVQEYINEVKPYTSKVREYRGIKNLELETANSHITDFDNPPYYNSSTSKVQPLLPGVNPSYDVILGTGIYKDYLDNHTDTNLLRASKVSLLFDRVSNNIFPAKTYLTTGNVGVDSRTVHHELALTDAQRYRNAIIDLNTRTTVGDLISGAPSDHASQRVAKYSTATSTYITTLATMKLTTDDNIKNHPIIVANAMSTLTSITYDQLQGADTYYKMANGYHEDLTLTVHAAVGRYDYDVNAVLRTGTNVEVGNDTDAQIAINDFVNDYRNTQTQLSNSISGAFYDVSKVEREDGSRFDMTTFENDTPVPQEWGWDSQAWDYTVVEDGYEKALTTWDEGQTLPVLFSEFPNFAVEATSAYGNDRVGWHIYNVVTKAGVESVYYSNEFIYVTASGIPDHESNLHDPIWPYIDEVKPNIIVHQNIKWNIPGEVVIPLIADKENTPTGIIAILRNGVALHNVKTRDSYGNDSVWHYNAMYTAGGTTGYGPGTETFFWRHRDQHGGIVDYNGQYHYYANPTAIYNDNLFEHSPLLGYAFDGVPIYGPQGYASKSYTGDGTTTVFAGPSGPEYATALMNDLNIKIKKNGTAQIVTTDFTYTGAAGNEKSQITFGTAPALDSVILFTVTSKIQKMRSSYRLKTGTRVAIGTEPAIPTGSYDGTYYEDYEYVAGLGDLDEYNGRIAYTPEKPSGMYAYYVTVDDDGLPVYPYVIGPKYYGKPENANYDTTASPVTAPDFMADDPDQLGIPNLSIDRQDRDSKDFVRPTHEQWPDELIPISSKEGLQITVQTNNHYTLGSVTDWLSFRIYYDADGETKYYALPNDAKTTAAAAITKLDTEISVTDVKVLPEPYLNSLGTGYTVPGVVFIGSERVEYLDIDITNNKLLLCRRGTGTTSVQDHASSTAIFSGDANNILTYDTESTWSPDATNGLNASTSDQAVFFKNRAGNALA